MKKLANKILLFTVICVFFSMQTAFAQKQPTTKISYEVDSGPVFPIDGESVQMKGKLSLDDNTGEIQSLSYHVTLMSFIGSHGAYLAWLGNARSNPDLNFKSTSITKKKGQWEVNGQLEFRRRFKPVTIDLKREDKDGDIVLTGNFQLSTGDYFIGYVPADLVANWIPFQFTMVFDKPDTVIKGETLSTN
ncbi:MAG: YceI family protein [Aequorivita sp.]